MVAYVRFGKPGAVLVGSHVAKTTEQLKELLNVPGAIGIEVEIQKLVSDPTITSIGFKEILAEIVEKADVIHAAGNTPVIYTSRGELTFDDAETRLRFGECVSTLLMEILKQLPQTLGFLISKGGITSNDTLSQGLSLRTVKLLGQVIPGVSMVCTEKTHPQFPELPIVLFPGNVGDSLALATVYRRLSGGGNHE
jgi:uncharacterized protein YgbK (DUF1537 family)